MLIRHVIADDGSKAHNTCLVCKPIVQLKITVCQCSRAFALFEKDWRRLGGLAAGQVLTSQQSTNS